MATSRAHQAEWRSFDRTLVRRVEHYRELPMGALAAVRALRRSLDELEREAVASARDKGATWEDIAEALGVSRQAAYQRHRSLGR